MKQIFVLLLGSALLAGCAAYSDNKKESALEKSTLFYEKAIRWGDFVAASQFQHADAGSPQAAVDLEKIKVTSYRQISSQPLADDNEVEITVSIDYYNNDAMKVHTLRDVQVWKYDPDASDWRITTPLPAFR